MQRVVHTVLLFLHLNLCRKHPRTAQPRHRPSLAETLLELFAVVVGRCGFDLGFDLTHARLNGRLVARTVHHCGVVFVDGDFLCRAEVRHRGVLQLQARFLGDHLTSCEDGNVLEHGLATVPNLVPSPQNLQGAADLVDHERGQRLSVDVFCDDQQRTSSLGGLLQHGNKSFMLEIFLSWIKM